MPPSFMQGMKSPFCLGSYFVESSAQSKSSRVRFRELLRNEEFQLERFVHVLNQLGHQLQVTGLIRDIKMMVGYSLDLDLDIVGIVGIGNRSAFLPGKERPIVDRDIV